MIGRTVIRSRRLRVTATAVLGLAVVTGLSGCGGPSHAGAAVIVDGQRTSDGQIQSQVNEFVAFAQHNGVPDAAPNAGIAQSQVNNILQAAVWQRLAANLGVTVTGQQVAELKSQMVDGARQTLQQQNQKKFTGTDDQAIVLADAESQSPSNLAPSQVDAFVRTQADITAIIDMTAAKLNITDTTDAASQQKLADTILPQLATATNQVKITVSPRYGSYDAERRSVIAALPDWIRQTASSAQDTAPGAQQQ